MAAEKANMTPRIAIVMPMDLPGPDVSVVRHFLNLLCEFMHAHG
jgi:hypothetical protein